MKDNSPNISRELELFDDLILNQEISGLQRELLDQVELILRNDDSRYAKWRSLIFTACQNRRRSILSRMAKSFDIFPLEENTIYGDVLDPHNKRK